MLTLFHAPQSRSSRMIWLAEELGADVAVRCVTIGRQDGSGGRDPSNPHPDGKVPALVHDGALVTESIAIAILLNDLHAGSPVAVPPDDPLRGPFLTWLAWYAGVVEPVLQFGFAGLGDNPVLRRTFRGRKEMDARIVAALERGAWLLGDRFSAADAILASAALWMRDLLPAGRATDEWLARCFARPALARAQARDAAPA
jgi:glutathione S-transferase